MKYYYSRKEYDYDLLNTVWNIYEMDVERIDSWGTRYMCDVPESEVQKKLRELNVFFVGPGEYPSFKEWPSFDLWLQMRYRTTPQVLYEVGKQTSRRLEFEQAMSWYRARYRAEKETWEELKAANPF